MKESIETENLAKTARCGASTNPPQTAVSQNEALKKVCTNVLGISSDRVSVVHLQNPAELQAFVQQWKDSNNN